MPTVPARRQFGPDDFTVQSEKGATVAAKYLRDASGANYIINPLTGQPYIVPEYYDPGATAAYFARRLKELRTNVPYSVAGEAAIRSAIYNELTNAFVQGAWGDLQRPLLDKTDVVPAFIPAASFNLGVAAASGGISVTEAKIGGGLYNVRKNWRDPKVKKDPWQFGNNPDNPPQIDEGADQYHTGALGAHPRDLYQSAPVPPPRLPPSRRWPGAPLGRSRPTRRSFLDQDTPATRLAAAMPFGIDDAYLRSGEELDRVAIANHGRFDSKAMEDLAIVLDDYNQKGLRSSQALDDLHREVWRIAADETEREESSIPGRFYPQLRRLVEQNLRSAGSDPHLIKALRDTGDALDRMFSRSISPEHGEAWQNALIARRNA